jgi:hypothetical protein
MRRPFPFSLPCLLPGYNATRLRVGLLEPGDGILRLRIEPLLNIVVWQRIIKKYFGAAGMRSVCSYRAMSARGYALRQSSSANASPKRSRIVSTFFPVICFSPTQKGVVMAFVSERETSTDARVTGGLELVPTDGRGTDTAVSGEDVVRNPV